MARASKPPATTSARPASRARSAAPELGAAPAPIDAAAPLPKPDSPVAETAVADEPATEIQVVAPPEEPAPPVEAATSPPAPEPATPEPATPEPAVTEPVAAEARPPAPTPDTAASELAPAPAPAPAGTGTPSLPGITLSFWQEQLERTLTAGQAILVCRSPEEAVRLQLAYVRATLTSGFERVGEVTRWSQAMVREVLPSRPR